MRWMNQRVKSTAAFLLSAAVFGVAALPLRAQTQPSTTTPRVEKAQARAMIQQLLREGKIMRADEAKRGMRGIGRSVFQGTKIEEFNIEVIGTLKKVMGGGDLVLIKVLDGPVVKRQSGIIAGMSGSPVYINGKMLGAIAIGFGFPKEPIGGVTPITQMIEGALPDSSPKAEGGTRKAASVGQPGAVAYKPVEPLTVAGRRISQVVVSRDSRRAALSGSAQSSTMTMRPATMLMQVSGFSAQAMPRLKQMMEPYGIEPVLGMGGGMMGKVPGSVPGAAPRQAFSAASEKSGVNPPFIPGGAIGVPLVTGDMDMSAVGTITFRWGNRILGFGHPMFGKGAVSMPMTTSYIHDIFPSYQQSFKLASPVKEVGVLQQDTEFAIGGTVGRKAEMVPMHIRLRNPERQINRTYNLRMIKDPLFTPLLMQMVSSEAVMGALGMDSDKMVRVKFRMELANLPTIEKQDYIYAQNDVGMPALGDLFEAVMLTQGNPFSRADIKRVDLDVTLEPVRKTAIIKRISADRNRVKAGETVRVNVFLEPHEDRDRLVTRTFSITVPDDAPDGILRVAASPGSDFWQGQARVGGAPPKPNDLKELIEAYAQVGTADELMVQASTPRAFLQVGRQKIANPPSSWAALVPPRASSSISAYNETQTQKQKQFYSLAGSQFLSIPVESGRHSDREKPDTGTTDGAAKSSAASASIAATTLGDEASFDPAEFEYDEEELALENQPFMRRLKSSGLYGPHMKMWLNSLRKERRNLQVAPAAVAAITPAITPVVEKTETKTTASATATSTPEPNANLARPASKWVQDKAADFGRGTLEGVGVSSEGAVRPAPIARLLATTTQPVAWSIAADRFGNTYLGAGHEARIFRINAQGESTLIYDGAEVAVTALTTDAAGNLYAGLTPGAKVLRFGRDGTATPIFDGNETFVWALEWDAQGRLLIGTGGERGSIYRLENAAARNDTTPPAPLARTPQKHVRSLAVRGGDLFAGTGDDAVLYQIAGDTGALKALYEAGTGASPSMGSLLGDGGGGVPSMPTRVVIGGGMGMPMMGGDAMMLMAGAEMGGGASGAGLRAQSTEILGLVALEDGVYFGTASSGTIYRWTPENGATPVYTAPARAIYALKARNGKLLAAVAGSASAAARAAEMSQGSAAITPVMLPSAGARGAVYEIAPAANGAAADDTRAMRLLDTSQPQVLALAVSPAGDVLAATGNNAAVYRVPSGGNAGGVFTSNVLDAGRVVRWGALRVLGDASIETRSGNTLEPDATWSQWQSAGADNERRVASPSARYLQYRAKLAPSGMLSRVEVLYRAQNQTPSVTFTAPVGGDYFKAKKKLTWTGKDPDGDTLRYRLWLSREGGEWQSVELKKPATASYELPADKWPNGVYRAKVEATDRERNPEDPRRDEAISEAFTLDNAAPGLDGQSVQKQDGGWRLRAVANDNLSPIIGAEWRVFVPKPAKPVKKDDKTEPKAGAAKDDKAADAAADDDTEATEDDSAKTKEAEWHAMAAADGIFDARREEVVGFVEAAPAQGDAPEIKSGTTIEIRARDAAGNTVLITVTLP